MNNRIPSVDKTASLIELLAASRAPLPQSILAKRLGITPSTTYRILQTLIAHRWVRKTQKNGFELWNGMMPVVYYFHDNLDRLEQARELLNRIAEEHQFACKLSVRRGNEQVTIMRAEPHGPYSVVGHKNATFPLIEGSVGAALLCDESEETLRALAQTCKSDIAEARDPQLLLKAVAQMKTDGHFVNSGNNRWRICAISAPVRTPSGDIIAALTFLGTESDFSKQKIKGIAELVKRTAAACGNRENTSALAAGEV